MNRKSENPLAQDAAVPDAEATLRLIAALPAPDGLEGRIHAALASPSVQARHAGRVLAWRSPRSLGGASSGWLRSAAAAAIAFVVVGGGWGVYSRVQPVQPGRVVPGPARVESFGSSGAIRTPQTLNGPVLTHPVKPHTALKKPAKKQAGKAPPVSNAMVPDMH